MEGDGHRGGQRPRRGGPDDGADLACVGGQLGRDGRRIALERVLHVDAGAGVVVVLDLGLGQRGAVVDAPVDRLQSLVDQSLLEEGVEVFDDLGLVAVGHGGVGMVEVAEDADALELLALDVEILFGVLAAGVAHLERVHLQLFAAQRLIHLDFDGQAVAVPAGHVGRIEAGHGAGLDDEILEALVERVAEMDGAVGVGRAVMQDVGGRARRATSGSGRRCGCCCQRSSIFGSFCGRFAFMGKSVVGRLTVALRSTRVYVSDQ